MRQLTGSDAFFYYSDRPGQHQHISTLYLYDQSTAPGGKVRFKTILDHIRDRLSTSRVFRQRLVEVPLNLDYPYWIEDANFQLEFHVRHIALPRPGNWRQLCTQVSRLHARALDMSRPAWEMYVIEGLDDIPSMPEGAFAVFTKIHHAAVDDATEDDFTIALHDLPSSRDSSQLRLRWHPEREPGISQMLALAWFNNTTRLLETAQLAWENLPCLGKPKMPVSDSLPRGGDPAPQTRFDQAISPHRSWDARVFELKELEAIQRKVEAASLLALVVTICAGAVHRYLESHDESTEHSLWALVPLHPENPDTQAKQARYELPGHHVRLVRVQIMSHIRNPLERLQAVSAELAQYRDTGAEDDTLNELQDSLPSTTMTLATRAIAARFGPGRTFRQNHNMVINMVPGPQKPLSLCGAKLIGFAGMGIVLDHLALNHTVTTYDGKLGIAALSDRSIMPDPEFYADCLQQAFDELRSATSARRRHSSA